jgi:Calx-beta domain-containing protein
VVHQYADNDRRELPPTGLPQGNLVTSFQWMDMYQTAQGGNELSALSSPTDDGNVNAHPLYDRWGDSFNVQTEFVIYDQGRGLGSMIFLMTRTPIKDQAWRTATAQITGLPATSPANEEVTASVSVSGMNLSGATVVWETKDLEPHIGTTFTFSPINQGTQWVEAEIQWPDGRRVSAETSFGVGNPSGLLPTVTMTVSDGIATESGDPGSVTVSRTGSTVLPLVVGYSVAGTASAGTDFAGLSGTVIIPIGATSATVTVNPISDSTTEGTETVVFALTPNLLYTIGSPSSGTVNISEGAPPPPGVPAIDVISYNTSASEVGLDDGSFTIMRDDAMTGFPLTVKYSMSGSASNGTDYNALSGSVTIPTGAVAVTVQLVPIADSVAEGSETATMTFLPDAAYKMGANTSATVTIADGPAAPVLPTVTVTATDPDASEGGGVGLYTVSRTGGSTSSALSVNYSIGGTATNGTDYGVLTGTVTIPVGASSVLVTVSPSADSLTEGSETVVLTIASNSGYQVGSPSSATVTIADGTQSVPLPTVSMSVTDSAAAESGSPGSVTISRSGNTSAALTVTYTVGGSASNGVDYSALSGTLSIPAGSTSATVVVQPISDGNTEGTETVVLALSANAAYQLGSPTGGTINIADDGVPNQAKAAIDLISYDSTGSEIGANLCSFTFMRSSDLTTFPLTVRYTLSGTATNGSDYGNLTGVATIPAGSNAVTVMVVPYQDSLSESTETVVATLVSDPAYNLGLHQSATATISDNTAPTSSLPIVNILPREPLAIESTGIKGSVFITRAGKKTAKLKVNVIISGTATNGKDYSTLTTSVIIPAGVASVVVKVVPVKDDLAEPNETVVMTIAPSSAYDIGVPTIQTITIRDQ